MKPNIAQVWTFRSDSSDREYETLRYVDGATSCNCPGWTRRIAADGTRTCKHTRLVDQGRADQASVGSHEYRNNAEGQRLKAKLPEAEPSAFSPSALPLGARRFVLETPSKTLKAKKLKS